MLVDQMLRPNFHSCLDFKSTQFGFTSRNWRRLCRECGLYLNTAKFWCYFWSKLRIGHRDERWVFIVDMLICHRWLQCSKYRIWDKNYAQHAGAGNGRILVLDRVNFHVPRNQFVCLLGPSGCGKTTLLRIVAGLTQADDGKVRIEGREVGEPGRDRAMVFQNYGLLPWRTVMGNVEFGLEIQGVERTKRREICQRYIDRVGLKGFSRITPTKFQVECSSALHLRVLFQRILRYC